MLLIRTSKVEAYLPIQRGHFILGPKVLCPGIDPRLRAGCRCPGRGEGQDHSAVEYTHFLRCSEWLGLLSVQRVQNRRPDPTRFASCTAQSLCAGNHNSLNVRQSKVQDVYFTD